MGRPSKLPQAREAVLVALAAGATRSAAAAAGGVPYETLSRWMARSEEFRHAVEKAEGAAELHYADLLERAARRGSISAIQFWLERRRPEAWRLRTSTEVTGSVVPIEQTMTEEENLAEIARLVELAASRHAGHGGQRDESVPLPAELSRIEAGHDGDVQRRRRS